MLKKLPELRNFTSYWRGQAIVCCSNRLLKSYYVVMRGGFFAWVCLLLSCNQDYILSIDWERRYSTAITNSLGHLVSHITIYSKYIHNTVLLSYTPKLVSFYHDTIIWIYNLWFFWIYWIESIEVKHLFQVRS